jgi:hypothetical protein
MNKVIKGYLLPLLFIPLCACGQTGKKDAYHLDNKGISRTVLENYLSRATTMAEFLTVDPYVIDATYPGKEDDIRLIKNLGVKFVGRAIYRWGKEKDLNNPAYLQNAKKLAERVHQEDKDIIFQGGIFEAVTPEVNLVAIPAWTFEALGLQTEQRNFRYDSMLNLKKIYVDHWGAGSSVPDITRIETKLWMMFLAGSYINIGCEALHYGQIALVGMEDEGFKHWKAYMEQVRRYAARHARRQWVLLDAHTPSGGMVVDGKSLLDFNAYPLRIKEVVDKPMEGILEKGYLDAFYGRSQGAIAPSGWNADALPYLLEVDNFGCSDKPGVADTTAHFIWGYDEITWFCLQTEKYRQDWLRYAYNWIKQTDENAFLAMPVSRLMDRGKGYPIIKTRANTASAAVPDGLNLEETIKDIWAKETR